MGDGNEIIHADCISHLKGVAESTFDLIIADPPYFEIYGDFDFVWKTVDDYIEWCKQWLGECTRVLKPTGTIYVWGVMGFGKGFPLVKLVDWAETTKLLKVQNWITQRNSRGRGTKRGFMQAREELVFMTKGDNYTWNPSYTKEKSTRTDLGADGKPRKNEFMRCSDVWIDITEASQSSNQRFKLPGGDAFPTVKALELCRRIINASSNRGDSVYIPFGGSGSEAVVCQQLGRRFVLTELEKSYLDHVIQPRLDEASLGQVEF